MTYCVTVTCTIILCYTTTYYQDTSGVEMNNVHQIVEMQLAAGVFLLPNNEYEFALGGRSPTYNG